MTVFAPDDAIIALTNVVLIVLALFYIAMRRVRPSHPIGISDDDRKLISVAFWPVSWLVDLK